MLPPVQSFLNNGSRWRKGSKETTSVQGNHDWLEQKYLDGERRPAGVVSPDCFQHVEKKSQELPAANVTKEQLFFNPGAIWWETETILLKTQRKVLKNEQTDRL